MLRLIVYLAFALLTTRRSPRSNNPMATEPIFPDVEIHDDNGTGDIVNSDENPLLKRAALAPEDQADVFLNYGLAQRPNGSRALRISVNGEYIDVTAAQAEQLSVLLGLAASDLADIRLDVGGES